MYPKMVSPINFPYPKIYIDISTLALILSFLGCLMTSCAWFYPNSAGSQKQKATIRPHGNKLVNGSEAFFLCRLFSK